MEKEKIVLWLDDIRDPNDYLEEDFTWVKNFKDFIECFEYLINKYSSEDIILDLDHDLGDDKTGYDCAWYVVNFCINNNLPLPEYRVHSQNPIGAENIKKLFDNYLKFKQND